MKKSTLAIVLMLGAALSASAITTTLEYEDQREAASRAAISNEITQATVNARDVADLAVYGKVGVGATWMLIGDDGAMTNSATGVFTDSGDGLGSWAFYVGGRLVAASYATCTTNDYEVEWRGGRDVGLAGVALRSYGFRPTADRLATTNGMVTAGMVTNIVLGVAPVPGNYAAVSNAAMNAANYTDQLKYDLQLGNVKVDQAIVADQTLNAFAAEGLIVDVSDPSSRRSSSAIFAQLDAATTTNAQQSAQMTTLSDQVTAIGAYLNAEDARFVATNYNSVTHLPEAYVELKLPSGEWSVVWREMTRWNWLTDEYLPTNFYGKSAIDAALADKADRAWGFYDSHSGEYAPEGYTWISSPKIAIAGGLAYQRTLVSEGEIWVLESNGMVAETGGETNGYFRITDGEGVTQFEIVKGDKRVIGADASSCQVVAGFSPTKLQIGYSVEGAQPKIYVCNSLATQNWKAEGDSDCLANVSWSGSSGAWVAQVQGKTAQSSLFVKATYEAGGETYIRNVAPVGMDSIILNGVKYYLGTATISGHTVLTLSTTAP